DWKIDKAILRTAAEAVQVRPATAAPVAVLAERGRNTATAERALAATIWGEARGESEEGKLAVASVIANRATRPGWWGRDIRSVCLATAQFSCWWDAQGPRVRNIGPAPVSWRGESLG
ncbi:MAG TPA: cell wall hydrolase, partial [Rhodospirillales bacterium]|nr:cell wall hydrolase [Rhodospirillales bacterium]